MTDGRDVDLRPTAHWSKHVYTRMNWLLRRLLQSRLHSLASERLVLLCITGRRTGRQYEIGVGYVQAGKELLVLVSDASNRNWWRNFVGGGDVTVVVRGERRRAHADAYRPSDDEFAEIADVAMPGLGRGVPQTIFGLKDYSRREGLTEEQLRWLDGFAVAVRIQLLGAA